MQAQAGIVKSVVGGAMVIDQSGAQRSLKAGDMVYLGEKIVTQDASSKVVITQNDGRDVTMIGKDALVLDQSIAAQESFGNETVTADTLAPYSKHSLREHSFKAWKKLQRAEIPMAERLARTA